MKLLVTTTCILLFSFNLSANKADNIKSTDASSKADACLSCHNTMVDLKGRGVEKLIKQTNAIKSGEKSHLPAGIKELCDEDIADIAAFLDKA